jgi:protein gp37
LGGQSKKEYQMKNKPVFNKVNDNIDWAKWSWNPVTGCEHGCKYCYARDIANRFYPEKFEPTFRPERLAAPLNTTIPKSLDREPGRNKVFVCSMADLFGDWVPQEWIDSILDVCKNTPKWTYIFLTKNPKKLATVDWPKNAWVGTTVDCQSRVDAAQKAFADISASVKFLSCEPLSEKLIFTDISVFDWVIIGARSKSSNMPAMMPKGEWIVSLLTQAWKAGCQVYCKPNLTILKRYPVNRS